ncbi:MAG: hypothetical protein NXI02_03605 [Rhodobacteraceae bacterium]|nr:hypothetical protein [Paracoccaceae bacterium]
MTAPVWFSMRSLTACLNIPAAHTALQRFSQELPDVFNVKYAP